MMSDSTTLRSQDKADRSVVLESSHKGEVLLASPAEHSYKETITSFFRIKDQRAALLLHGDAKSLLSSLPLQSIDTCLTSPPYWSQRLYDSDSGLGQESHPAEYIERLCSIFDEVKHVLKPTGSLWLNLGDTYERKRLCGIPWGVALTLQERGWILRNAVVWDKVKGNPCNVKDKLRDTYEFVFHFVLQESYYYDVDAIRKTPEKPHYRNGRIVTPTGVSGQKYEQQILGSSALSSREKAEALRALRDVLEKVKSGDIPDFRMIIRGTQRSTHSDAPEYSGRATELEKKGYCILPYHKNGTKPGDVWRIIPEDEWRPDEHYAVFPIELCEIPLRATCPPGGILLDPFVGSGSALAAAILEGRRGVGIDTSRRYLKTAAERIRHAWQRHRSAISQQHFF